MNNYIYEMHVAFMRISYVIPDDFRCDRINTILYNGLPGDGTKIEMRYEAWIYQYNMPENVREFQSFAGENLQAIVEKARVWSVLRRNKQSPVDKCPADGTDSLVSTQ